MQVTIHQADHTCGVLALATCGDFLVSGSDGGIKVGYNDTASTTHFRENQGMISHFLVLGSDGGSKVRWYDAAHSQIDCVTVFLEPGIMPSSET